MAGLLARIGDVPWLPAIAQQPHHDEPHHQQQQQQQQTPPPLAAAANASAPASDPFAPGILMDSFLFSAGQASPLMQLVIFLYRQLGAHLGLDPSLVVTVLVLLWGLARVGAHVSELVSGLFDRYFTCAMFVSEHDHIYTQLMKWLSHQHAIRSSRFLMAQTVWKSAWEDEDEPEEALSWTDADGDSDGDGGHRYLNFSNHAARSMPRYVPAIGLTSFWHEGTHFHVHRKKESVVNTHGWSPMKDLEELKISCSGRSIEPIKRLLADAKAFYYHDTYRKTTIYRPRPKEQRHESSMWQQVARRPVRPMSTVVLDTAEKHGVLADVNEYLHPATPRWYASRGIPLRRGYLFHGPPGTGKTSFSFALAGVFGIDIYVISLQDVNVTEEDLATLFTRLPRRCIVLLEDIDTAGLRRDTPDTEAEETAEDKKPLANGVRKGKRHDTAKTKNKKANGGDENKEKKANGADESKEKKANGADDSKTSADGGDADADADADADDDGSGSSSSSSSESEDEDRRPPPPAKHKGGKDKGARGKGARPDVISLSGLLNAIDGVASHEGRVLIMTTNKPESLDPALVRPGRVDVQVAFNNASSTQAAELFRRMYEASRPRRREAAAAAAAKSAAKTAEGKTVEGKVTASREVVPAAEDELDVSGEEELQAVAAEFGRQIPEGTFSPAEIQGFLLKRKKSPRKALEDARGWVAASVKQKAAHSRVSTVQ